MYTYVYYLVINRHNICDLHWVPWISFSTRCILPFDSPGSVGPSCCSCSRGFHWSYSGHQFVFGTAIVPGEMWDVGCGFGVLPWEFWWCSRSVSPSQIIYQVLLGTPQKNCTETHLVDLWGYGYWIIWYVYVYIYIYIHVCMETTDSGHLPRNLSGVHDGKPSPKIDWLQDASGNLLHEPKQAFRTPVGWCNRMDLNLWI